MSLLDAKLPQDHVIERALLGSVLFSAKTIDRVAGIVTANSFAKPAHKTIYRAMSALVHDGIELDLLTLRDRLVISGEMVKAGGVDYLWSLTNSIPDVANVERYAKIIREKAALRELIEACYGAAKGAMRGDASTEVASWLSERMATLGVNEEIASRGIYTVVAEARREADERAERGEMIGVQTGLDQLDEMTLGLPREALSVLGGRTSHGKTTLALNLIMSAINRRHETKAVMYSLEMSKAAVADSIRARISGVPLGAIRDWTNINEFDRARVIDSEDALLGFNRRFFYADRISEMSDLVADARMRYQETGLDLVVVDYLQLVGGMDEDTRERTVNQIAWRLSELAKDLKIAVLALSQVTLTADMRKDGRLSVDDLRDSKAVGHHARLVLLMSRPWQSNKTRTDVLPCHTLLQVEKQSQGVTGDIVMHFDGAFQRFDEGACHDECRVARKAGHGCQECARVHP